MPFGNIVSQTKTYAPRLPGIYELNTVTFGQPRDFFDVRGASKGKDGALRGSIARVFQKDVDINGSMVRKQMALVLSIAAYEAGFTAAEIDSRIEDLSVFATADTITRIMQGES